MLQIDFTLRNPESNCIEQRSLQPLLIEGTLGIRLTIQYLASVVKLHMRGERKDRELMARAITAITNLFFQYLAEDAEEELREVFLNRRLQKAFWKTHINELLSHFSDHPDSFTSWLLSDLLDRALAEVQRAAEKALRRAA